MHSIDRRDFLKSVVVGGAVLALDAAIPARYLSAAEMGDLKAIGECKKVTITCVSELGWYDNKALLADMMKGGGPKKADQWLTEWDPKNAAGSCSLVEVEALNGSKTRFLIDTGWNVDYMDKRLKDQGVDRMLKNGEIAFLYVTHEHLDHFWGLESTLKCNPEIKILIPSSLHSPALEFIAGKAYPKANAKNAIHHKGDLVKLEVGKVTKLADGVASVGFDIPILLKIRGEQSLFFNIKDKGLVLCTGCCHQNVVTFADYAITNLGAKDKLYGLYGGLHIAPFGSMGEKEEGWIKHMASYGFKQIAANHCTGLIAVEKMIEAGYPVVRGTGQKGSISNLYIGNGDTVVFG